MNSTLTEEMEKQMRNDPVPTKFGTNTFHLQKVDAFFNLCEKLTNEVAVEQLSCSNYEDVFKAIEKNHIDISDILSENDYCELKSYLTTCGVSMGFYIGTQPRVLSEDGDFGGCIRE